MPTKNGFRVTTSARRTIELVFSLTLFAALAISYAPAADAQYLYCWTANLRTGSDQMFFSRVFSGDVSERGPMQIAFQKYVNENYQNSNPGPGACKNYSSRRDAESDLALDLKEKRDFEKQQVVETGWTFHAKTSTTKYCYCLGQIFQSQSTATMYYSNVFRYAGGMLQKLADQFWKANSTTTCSCYCEDTSEAATTKRQGMIDRENRKTEVQFTPN